MDNPYLGMRRVGGHVAYWFGKIPDTYAAATDTVVTCSYWINETSHEIKCDVIASLSPIFTVEHGFQDDGEADEEET